MSSSFFGNRPKDKNSIESLRESWAKSDIRKSAESSRKKLDLIIESEDLESKLRRQEAERAEQRAKLHAKTGETIEEDSFDSMIYQAKAAIIKNEGKPRRREGILHRTIKMFRGFSNAEKELAVKPFPTQEKADVLYANVFSECWSPLVKAMNEAEETLWGFLCKIGRDAWNIVLFVVDLLIAAWYYISSFGLYLWDVLWDFRFWLDKNKQKLFTWFASFLSAAAVVLIVISSVSAYEYSYYGKVLGIAKSKQDVYQTIDILGDKLSVVSGANINIDVERDIEFKRVFGFKLNIDSTDDILNTLNYMKDLQTEAYAVYVDGKQMVILENEDVAKELINNIRNDYAGAKAGVEYNSVTFQETVTIEPVNVLLADVWNPNDALRYMETGTVEENPEEGYEAKSLVTVLSSETATYEEEVPFDIDYVENSGMYTDEKKMITDGVKGTDVIVALVTRVNGEETSRTIVSTTRISNPISATYYQGTKPIPDRKGTGTWIWPLKVNAIKTTSFHERYDVAGVSPIHQGVDYACATGNKIYAADGGVVTFAGYRGGFGYCVEIDHGGLYVSIYGHCSKLLVKAGDNVYQGQNIALVGSTGISTGSHLHFEIRYKDIAVDPEQFY